MAIKRSKFNDSVTNTSISLVSDGKQGNNQQSVLTYTSSGIEQSIRIVGEWELSTLLSMMEKLAKDFKE